MGEASSARDKMFKYFHPDNTVDGVAKRIGYEVYDCALPQDWVDWMLKYYEFNPVGHFVWCYDDSKIFGEPMPVSKKGYEVWIEKDLEKFWYQKTGR